MRTLFYLLDGDTNASSWHRALQYFPLLARHGIIAHASRPVPTAVYDRLVEQGTGSTRQKSVFYSLFLASRLIDVLRGGRYDVVVIQRDLFPFGPPFLERLLLRENSRLVYDTDDATYLRPSFTPNSIFQRLRDFGKVAEVVRRARWTSVATAELSVWASRHSERVSVVPMAVDLALYDRASAVRTRTEGRQVVLGWAGTGGGIRYLEQLAPVLARATADGKVVVRILSGAFQSVHLAGVRYEALPWRPASGLAELAGFDIGLVPLDDGAFERAKFPFKMLQFLALGVPVVASPVGVVRDVIRHGENGLLAATPEEWFEAIARLSADPLLRVRLARAGRETVAANFTVERVGPLIAEGLLAVARS